MTDHKIGTRAEWQAARDELAKLEAEHAEHNAEIKRRRLALPWVSVEKKYEFETEAGRRTLWIMPNTRYLMPRHLMPRR